LNLLLNLWCIGVVYQLCLVPLVPKVTMVLYCTVPLLPTPPIRIMGWLRGTLGYFLGT